MYAWDHSIGCIQLGAAWTGRFKKTSLTGSHLDIYPYGQTLSLSISPYLCKWLALVSTQCDGLKVSKPTQGFKNGESAMAHHHLPTSHQSMPASGPAQCQRQDELT